MNRGQYCLRVNKVEHGTQVIKEYNLRAGSVAFFDGAGKGDPADMEARCFIDVLLGKRDSLYVTADQAAVVTRILEGIYESEKTGKPYYFD